MMDAILLFHQTNNVDDQEAYLAETQQQFYRGGDMGTEGRIVLLSGPLPVAAEAARPRVPRLVDAKIREGEAGLLKDLRPRFPSRTEERVKREWFSYLEAPFQSYLADTIVLTRETDAGAFYVLFPRLKKHVLRDEASGATFLQILDGDRTLYPTPPMRPLPLQRAVSAAATTYAITSLKADSSTSITFGWNVSADPANVWWALYRGIMPSWENIDEYAGYDYISPKGSGYGKTGTQTVTVPFMQSGAIHTFAILGYKWNLGDYQQFTAP